jgi:putative ABC transport system permease protein
MLFVSICTLSSGMGLARAIAVRLRSNTPFDATLALHHSGAAPGEEILEAKLRAGGVDIGAFAREYRGARYYDAGVDISLMVQGKAAAIRAPFIALSDFNALLSMQGAEPVNLGGGEFAINSAVTGGAWPAALSRYVADGADILAGGARLVTDPSRLYNYPLSVSQNTTSYFEIVVPDYALRGAGVILETLNMNYRDGGDDYERACRAALSGVRVATAAGVAQETFLTTKTQVYETSGASTAVIAYISVYLGVVFLLACVTVLAIGGLSRAGQDAARYALLRKLGADEDMINRALFWQTLAHFGAPMLPAAAHSAVGIALASRLVSSFGSMNILSSCLIAALFIAGIYGGYFVVAYISGKTLTSSA